MCPEPLFCVTQGENAAKKKEREKEAEELQEARCLLRNSGKVRALAHKLYKATRLLIFES